ncbi:MAG: cytochrome c [Myxococcales bacterium]|nr:cytochrome c [Myxococcales bacterium]
MRYLSFLLLLTSFVSCRGQESEQPPVHLNPNMDSQPRYDPQAESKFYEDRRTMRQPLEGTIARGNFYENEVYATGKEGDQYVAKIPVPITEAMLQRGQERYNIYCTPCHDATGSGQGLVVTRGGYPAATNLNEAYSRTMPDGQMYGAIAYGVRNMPSYAAQIPVDDRWAIVAYVRALQFSQNATIQDVPADKRSGMPVEVAR